MPIAFALTILLAAATPVHVTPKDLIGMWTTVRGRCSVGQHRLSANGEYTGWCFDSISQGKWWVRNGNSIVIQDGPMRNFPMFCTLALASGRSVPSR